MSRRAACLIAVAIGALGANTPLPSVAQEAGSVFRIGILSPAARPDTAIFDAFRKGLADLGYIDGQNIRIEYRLAAGDYSRLPAMAGELVRLAVDVIVTDTQKSAAIAHEATRTIPIVGATLGPDPVAAGLATSFTHPGAERKLSGKEEALLVATACSNPPEGRARWTLELLAGSPPASIRRLSQSVVTQNPA